MVCLKITLAKTRISIWDVQCETRHEDLLACARTECSHFNQKMWDKFDIERWDAG